MSKSKAHARGIGDVTLCGRHGARIVTLFQDIECSRCRKIADTIKSSYRAQALELLKGRDVISAGQVAYRVHGRNLSIEHNEAVDFALMSSPEFKRASMLGATRFAEVYLWRKAS